MKWTGLILAAFVGCSVAPPPRAATGVVVPPSPPEPTADEHYWDAERLFQRAEFELSQLECGRALKVNPRHGAASALWLELSFILGEGRGGSGDVARIRLSQFESLLDEGRTNLFFGSLTQAEDCARRALDLAEMLPPEMDVELRIAQAQALLDWVRVCREED